MRSKTWNMLTFATPERELFEGRTGGVCVYGRVQTRHAAIGRDPGRVVESAVVSSSGHTDNSAGEAPFHNNPKCNFRAFELTLWPQGKATA
jgi:hypothetical protein